MPINPDRSQLDQQQILQRVMDEANDRLRVDAEVTATIGVVDVNIDHINDSIRIGDGSNLVTTTTSGPKVGLDVNIISSLDVIIDGSSGDNIIVVGTDDGTIGGTTFPFVNTKRNQILAAADLEADFTWADFHTKNERVIRIDYTAPSVGSEVARKDFTYTLNAGAYMLTNINWSIV